MKWESSTAKAQLRYTSQKFGQEQAKHNSQATVTRADIATLIQQGNVLLAREKAEKLIQEDGFNDVLEVVELELGVILKRFQELEERAMPSPALVEAASTVLYSAPYIGSRDLDAVRNTLLHYLGPEFTHSVMKNRDGYVSQRVLQAMSLPVPSAYHLDYVLHDICKNYGISWSPDPPPRDFVLNSLSECLDVGALPHVDLIALRKLCLRGLPDEPGWLRPRIWKILFGLVSPTKSTWAIELSKQRDSYYDFVRRLLKPFAELSGSSHGLDEKVSETYKELSGLPRNLFSLLEEEPEDFNDCPLSDGAPDAIRIPYARILESRPSQLNVPGNGRDGSPVHLETQLDVSTPGISITTFDSEIWENGSAPKTLLVSRTCMFGNAHARHCSVLLRLLYLHNAVNPAKTSSHTASLLVPLYSVMLQEVDPEGLAHVEADTFWLLESIVAELSEVDEDGGQVWMSELGKRLAWADYDYFTELESQGLNPALPHYSYRWLAPLLSHTLPLQALFQTWDALFSRDLRGKGLNPKADYLVDICTSMILRGKNHLHSIWKAGQSSRTLWTNDNEFSSRSGTQDPFLRSLSFLQTYDLRHVGGVDRILQTAAELAQRRQLQLVGVQSSALSLKSRFNFWGSTNASISNGSQEISTKHPSPDIQKSPRPNSLTSQITNSVWRGITNQTAMEDEVPSPDSPIEIQSEMQIPGESGAPSSSLPASNMWGYAEKIKDSDALATLSKVSTNWRAKGILSGWRSTPDSSTRMLPSSNVKANPGQGSIAATHHAKLSESQGLVSPPSKSLEPSPLQSPQSAGSIIDKTKSLFLARSPPSTPKLAPKPLLLNSSRLTYSHSPRSSTDGLPMSTHTPDSGERDEWAEVMKLKRHHFHRESQSSASSLSPSDAFIRNAKPARSDWESDTTTSRIIPLNRRVVSPMAPHFRRPDSRASSVSSEIHSPPAKVKSPLHESSSIDVLIKGKAPSSSETEPESSDATSYQANAASRNLSPKSDNLEDTRPGIPARMARVRTRRHPRPANLQIPAMPRTQVASEPKPSEPSKSLKVEWPTDNQDSITTPRAANFDSGENSSAIPSGMPRSPRRSTSKRDAERLRKVSTDNINEERPRKVSARSRKVSGEGSQSRRTSPAEDGDDEGYDELLSAYESEDNHSGLSRRK